MPIEIPKSKVGVYSFYWMQINEKPLAAYIYKSVPLSMTHLGTERHEEMAQQKHHVSAIASVWKGNSFEFQLFSSI